MHDLEIFRSGRQTASNGQTLSFSDQDLQASVEAYDPAKHEAPIVVGHPQDNSPAYGWISGINLSDAGTMHATTHQVDAQFSEMVEAGRFKKRSASFYRPDSPANPAPGVYYLRHVGFLGAQPPAVKGLADPQFSDSPEDVVEFEDPGLVAMLFRNMREFIVDKFGMDAADSTLPGFLIETLEDSTKADDENPQPAAFNEPPTGEEDMDPKELEALQAKAAKADELEQQAADFTEREQALAERETAAVRADIERDLDKLVETGQILPAQKPGLADFMQTLDATDAVEFGEGDDATKASPREFMHAFLANLPKAVDYAERSGDGEGGEEVSDTEMRTRAISYQERMRDQGVEVSTTDAVRAVRAGTDKE